MTKLTSTAAAAAGLPWFVVVPLAAVAGLVLGPLVGRVRRWIAAMRAGTG